MTVYDLENLKALISKGELPKYLYFWGHSEKGEGVTKACFSQWYDSPFELNGVCYPTAEHYMMAEKARLFNDQEALDKVLKASNPGAAKAAGREVRGFQEELWNKHRFDIVVAGNMAKFQDDRLKAFLLGTSKRVLVEASPVDKIWGVGLAQDDENISNPFNWKGLNLLGFALMKVRDQIKVL